MLVIANFKLPLCKVGFSNNISIKVHILTKVKNCDISPQRGSLHTCAYHLSSTTLKDDWQDLLKVPTKNNRKTTKRLIKAVQVFK